MCADCGLIVPQEVRFPKKFWVNGSFRKAQEPIYIHINFNITLQLFRGINKIKRLKDSFSSLLEDTDHPSLVFSSINTDGEIFFIGWIIVM